MGDGRTDNDDAHVGVQVEPQCNGPLLYGGGEALGAIESGGGNACNDA